MRYFLFFSLFFIFFANHFQCPFLLSFFCKSYFHTTISVCLVLFLSFSVTHSAFSMSWCPFFLALSSNLCLFLTLSLRNSFLHNSQTNNGHLSASLASASTTSVSTRHDGRDNQLWNIILAVINARRNKWVWPSSFFSEMKVGRIRCISLANISTHCQSHNCNLSQHLLDGLLDEHYTTGT